MTEDDDLPPYGEVVSIITVSNGDSVRRLKSTSAAFCAAVDKGPVVLAPPSAAPSNFQCGFAIPRTKE